MINKTSGTVDLAKSTWSILDYLQLQQQRWLYRYYRCFDHDPCFTNATIAYGTYCARIVQK
ncbi:hypothetical protein FLA_1876 [Filimonas lacunae]|nr:hypothetical protein FLA_1876 [Filimonas lacunae]